ncbi:MAG: ABC transporter ATP-binding protein [Thermoguttaceae bacterium]
MNEDTPARDVLLRAEHLRKVYPDGLIRAIDDVSLDIRRGEYLAVMGRSGSGKSTLLNILGALDRPTSGEVYFDGQAVGAMPRLDHYRAYKVGFVFQSFYLLPMLTALENVQMPMLMTHRPQSARAERARQLLERVGLAGRIRHLPKNLSVGERQRVAVARALANDPAVILADEPTGNLDTATAAGIVELFDQLHRDGDVTIVMVTHDPEIAHHLPRVVRMQDGRIVADAG